MNIYEAATDKIIEFIETEEIIPWFKPWIGGISTSNLISNKPYQGINKLLISLRFQFLLSVKAILSLIAP